ncbi:MAG: magnesium transporter [Rhodothermia bacterium]|nr:magnesium transporter [Rhodothermia bacterium]
MEPEKNIAAGDAEAPVVPSQIEVGGELADNVQALVEEGQRGMVLNLVADLHAADLGLLLEHLPADRARTLFHWLSTEQGGEVLPELEDDFRATLLEEVRSERISALLDEMPTDDAADVLADLPAEVVEEVLPALEDKEELAELLAYDEESAGGIMGTEFVAVPEHWTVEQATEEVRRQAEHVEPIYAVFVVDSKQALIGGVSLKRLLLSQPGARMGDILDTDDLSVLAVLDQEDVARIMERYDRVSLPVVDGLKRVIGRITIDDIVDVIRDEAEEDIQRMVGVAGGEEHTDSVAQVSRGRLPWLLTGLVGAGISASIIAYFDQTLQQAVVLASFIPIVQSTAGNAGIQSSAIAVQGLASGDVWTSDLLRRIGKELLVAIINGVALAVALAAAVLLLMDAPSTSVLAFTAGLSLVIVIVLATTIGATVPLVLDRIGIDPALATGPFITVSNDIIGISVFFVLATLIYLS